jgi:hypothetical protein
VGQNVPVGHTGKRAGPKRKRRFQPALLLLAVGVTFAVVAWGYLVKAAIDFGATARGGDQDAWLFLGLASFGAVACLFVGLMLVSRVLRRLGITNPAGSGPSAPAEPSAPPAARPVGGRRAAR